MAILMVSMALLAVGITFYYIFRQYHPIFVFFVYGVGATDLGFLPYPYP